MFSRNRVLLLVGAFAGAAVLSAFLLVGRTEATVVDGGVETRIRVRAATVGEALQVAGIDIRPADLVTPPIHSKLESGLTIVIARASPVRVTAGDESQVVYTRQLDLEQILLAAGITVGVAEMVYVDGFATPLSTTLTSVPQEVVVSQSIALNVLDGSEQYEIQSPARTVGEALWEAGVVLRVADSVTPALDAATEPGMQIEITRAREFLVRVDGNLMPARGGARRVGDLLAGLGIELTGADYAVPALDQPVPLDGAVRVVRVTERTVTEQTPIPFETLTQAAADLNLDQTQQIQAGSNGVLARRLHVRSEDGVEVAREVEQEWVQAEPVAQIIGYGTNIVVRTVDTADGPVEYWRAVEMYSTSYSPSRSGTPTTAPWYGLTRSGKPLQRGMVAIDLDLMPLGTPLYIPGYGFATAEDTGGGVQGRLIDLGFSDDDYESRRGPVTVYFLTPAPPADQITWILP